jgi:hypothetical protein
MNALELVQREYDYLRVREGKDFFLALARYVNALHGDATSTALLGSMNWPKRT